MTSLIMGVVAFLGASIPGQLAIALNFGLTIDGIRDKSDPLWLRLAIVAIILAWIVGYALLAYWVATGVITF